MTIRSDFYIYVLFRENGQPFYIGKGHGYRMNTHLAPRWQKGAKGKNPHKNNIINNMLARGLDIPRVKLRSGLTEQEANQIEIALIQAIGKEPDGPLVNITNGGEGNTGTKRSAKHMIAFNRKGQKNSDAHKAAISRALKGRRLRPESYRHSEETRMKIRMANLGNTNCLGRQHSDETKRKLVEKAKARGIPRTTVEAAWRATRQKHSVRKFGAFACGVLSQGC